MKKKNISLERFIFALGIRHIGLENAKLISKNIKSSKNFISIADKGKFDELLNIDGIGETQINSLKNFFLNKTNLKIIKDLDKILTIKNLSNLKNNGVLRNKVFMLTGKLSGISRAEAKSLIEENSGIIISNVSKKLDYLITGDKPTKRKIDTARQLKIKIINQSELFKMLNKTS
jgi:DNA ligase (NAD+)